MRVGEAHLLFLGLDNGLAQLEGSVARRVVRLARRQGLGDRILQRARNAELGGREVADGEIADLPSFAFERCDLGGNAQDLGTGQTLGESRQRHFGECCWHAGADSSGNRRGESSTGREGRGGSRWSAPSSL